MEMCQKLQEMLEWEGLSSKDRLKRERLIRKKKMQELIWLTMKIEDEDSDSEEDEYEDLSDI